METPDELPSYLRAEGFTNEPCFPNARFGKRPYGICILWQTPLSGLWITHANKADLPIHRSPETLNQRPIAMNAWQMNQTGSLGSPYTRKRKSPSEYS